MSALKPPQEVINNGSVSVCVYPVIVATGSECGRSGGENGGRRERKRGGWQPEGRTNSIMITVIVCRTL